MTFNGGVALNPAILMAIILLCIILPAQAAERNRRIAIRIIQRKKNKKETCSQMKELAIKFIDKECLIYLSLGSQVEGTVKEVADGALIIERGGEIEALNLDYIVRLREYPKNKKGKKKSFVLD